ncbi:retrovirus-related Pol polyprotein from transposon opus [Trichonephila clavipes]|nr:retrovirus-related Pol polyprotein from transposon opus [Trichonephila clavipes]
MPNLRLQFILRYFNRSSTSFRRTIYNHLHNLSHPGIAASTKLICSRYVWPGMKCQIKKWVRCCESCRKSKIQRPTKTPLGTSSLPDAKFSPIRIDIVDPLQGRIYVWAKWVAAQEPPLLVEDNKQKKMLTLKIVMK